MDDTNQGKKDRRGHPQLTEHDPPNWITTQQLEAELWNAIAEDSTTNFDEDSDFEEIDECLGDDEEYEDEANERRSILRLLATMRQQLAELLGGPAAK